MHKLRLSVAVDVWDSRDENAFLYVDRRKPFGDLRTMPVLHDDDHVGPQELIRVDRIATVEPCGAGVESIAEECRSRSAPILALVADEKDVHVATESVAGI